MSWEDALAQAQRVKSDRTRLRQQVRAPRNYVVSRDVVAALLNNPQPALHRLRVYELLRWTWGMYEATARRLLAVVDVSEFQIVGRLTQRQRTELAILLRSRDLDVALKDAEADHDLRRWS